MKIIITEKQFKALNTNSDVLSEQFVEGIDSKIPLADYLMQEKGYSKQTAEWWAKRIKSEYNDVLTTVKQEFIKYYRHPASVKKLKEKSFTGSYDQKSLEDMINTTTIEVDVYPDGNFGGYVDGRPPWPNVIYMNYYLVPSGDKRMKQLITHELGHLVDFHLKRRLVSTKPSLTPKENATWGEIFDMSWSDIKDYGYIRMDSENFARMQALRRALSLSPDATPQMVFNAMKNKIDSALKSSKTDKTVNISNGFTGYTVNGMNITLHFPKDYHGKYEERNETNLQFILGELNRNFEYYNLFGGGSTDLIAHFCKYDPKNKTITIDCFALAQYNKDVVKLQKQKSQNLNDKEAPPNQAWA